jgi:rhamnose transport system permease protein
VADKNKAGTILFRKIASYKELGLIIAFSVILVAAVFVTPKIFQLDALHQMLRNYAVFGILAVAMFAVILTGGIDLSMGAVLALSGLISTRLMMAGIPIILCLVCGIGIGALCGFCNGVFVGKLKIIPLIATLSTMYIFRGIAYMICGGKWMMPNVYIPSYTVVALGKILGIYNILAIYIIVLIVAGVFFSQCRIGRRMYAVGTNPESALIAGINIGNIHLTAYLFAGILVGLGGFLYTANYGVWEPQAGSGFEMEAIAICVLGGVSITGGVGRVGGVVISTLLMSVISYFLSMLPGMSVWKMALQGALIITAVAINILTARFSASAFLKARIIS